MISRRKFLKYSALSATALVSELGPLRADDSLALTTTEIELAVPNLPGAFAGFRFGFASDFHLGAFVPSSWLEQSMSRLRGEKLDLLLLGGDYIGYRDTANSRQHGFSREPRFDSIPLPQLPAILYSEAMELLTRQCVAQKTFGVLGNHDYRVVAESRSRFAAQCGVQLLVNEFAEIRRGEQVLRVIGIDDERYGNPRLPQLNIWKNKDEARIVIAHNPDTISRILHHTDFQFDLGLAGHTHGGQVKLPLIGALQYNIKDLQFSEGLNSSGQTQVHAPK